MGLGFGDCGKGSIIDFLATNDDVHTVVRFNGGPQAGHNVVTSDGKHHTFSQFGSGTLAGDSVATLLSRFMLIEPYALINEAAHLQQLGCDNIWDRLLIDKRCTVITPVHQAMNRLREHARGPAAHGTCGLGIGEAMADSLDRPDLTLCARDLFDPRLVAAKLRAVIAFKQAQFNSFRSAVETDERCNADVETILRPRWIDVAVEAYSAIASAARIISASEVNSMLQRAGETLFEGAQGVLLDEDYGFHPHTTWSRTTPINAMQILREAGITEDIRRIGVLRSYMTRHGAGPLVTEQSELRAVLPEPHNLDTGSQGAFRVGVFDAVAARYAVAAAKVDEIAITHVDALRSLPGQICTRYLPGGEFLTNSGRDICQVDPARLDLRTEQTNAIEKCTPVFAEVSRDDPDSFVRGIQAELAVPVRILSYGPTAADKRTLSSSG